MDELPFGGLPEEYLACDRQYIAAIEGSLAAAAKIIAAELSGAYAVNINPDFLQKLIAACDLRPVLTTD